MLASAPMPDIYETIPLLILNVLFLKLNISANA
jgi:hypothetical protein